MRSVDHFSRTTSEIREIRLGLFALGFLGLLCAIMIGFVWALSLRVTDLAGYGYDTQLQVQSPAQGVAIVRPTWSITDSEAPAAAKYDEADRHDRRPP